jgi:hypothetical protein
MLSVASNLELFTVAISLPESYSNSCSSLSFAETFNYFCGKHLQRMKYQEVATDLRRKDATDISKNMPYHESEDLKVLFPSKLIIPFHFQKSIHLQGKTRTNSYSRKEI